ncbi:HD domain-containing phosphohydrolase [Candidatus Contubernalis alkaliaceticus]|uniref:HD domain-containing phosphohydrolase n=1 Tax=Candidatus Contubernalis alkaliaceticus TaxID=338645 RepID=UPI001F4C1A94|nr:HD domain-containing phosphohydrolase [Candidatus Contubernalis alkalaceticus]UNC91978.1 response regulator [Candidatus Contubernalis alkalaceticus]
MKEKILFVDDDQNVLDAYKRQFHRRFKIITAQSGADGISALKEQGPFSVIISDYRMPEMDGIQFLSTARELSPDTVRIILTGYADMNAAIDAVNRGNIFRFLTKPCPSEVFINAVTAGVGQYRLITGERELIEKTLKGSVKVLIDILSIVSPFAFGQASRISKLAKNIAERLTMERPFEVELAAMLSQIGCITLPVSIIEKKLKGETLTKDESKMFFEHPSIGEKLLSNIPRLEGIAEAIGYQFKQYNGKGTPNDDLKGNAIPLTSRILKVVIEFDTLKNLGYNDKNIIDKMYKYSGGYDPNVLAALDAELMSIDKGFIVRSISLTDILPGKILADDIRDVSGTVLITKGAEITNVLKFRLLNFARYNKIIEPIKILELKDSDTKIT